MGKTKRIDKYVLDIKNLIGKVNNRIDLVGVELEGGWGIVPPGGYVERDTSVKPWATDGDRRSYPHTGEIICRPPKVPAGIGVWMRKYYPPCVNHTCGLHVHMSFKKNKYYTMLMEQEYQETMLHFLGEWAKGEGLESDHPIWSRLNGESEYCTKNFWPDLQVAETRKDFDHHRIGNRYTAISYRGEYKTIEVRVLPMMKDPEMGVRAVKRVMDITNACLVAMVDKERGLEALVPIESSDEWESVESVRI